jgi:hypothetical protein
MHILDLLARDMYGNLLYDGDYIQGYNNRRFAGDKTRLYKTGIMRVTYPEIWRMIYDDTFEETNNPWVGKLDSPVTHKKMFWKI